MLVFSVLFFLSLEMPTHAMVSFPSQFPSSTLTGDLARNIAEADFLENCPSIPSLDEFQSDHKSNQFRNSPLMT